MLSTIKVTLKEYKGIFKKFSTSMSREFQKQASSKDSIFGR